MAACRRAAGAVLFVLAFVAVCPADDCPVLIPEKLRTAEILDRAEHVSAVLDKLVERREAFLNSGDIVEIFPALYFHTTRQFFEKAFAFESDVSTAMLKMIEAFHDAYEYNRIAFDTGGAKAVEPHWKKYYVRASQERRRKPGKPISLLTAYAILLHGIDAHLIDLGRTVRNESSSHIVRSDAFREAYFRMNKVFARAAQAANRDLSAALGIRSRLLDFERSLSLGARYIIQGRTASWNEGIGVDPLRAKGPHPVMPSQRRSFYYFTTDESHPCYATR
ncbi:MAG: hypothetical protein KF881_07690 [Acidobacteria bacterium]|nr:hypothetical protein [Acidobacteriota bacterium]